MRLIGGLLRALARLAARIRVRGPGGRYRQLSLHQATARQILEAAGLLRAPKRGARRVPRAFRPKMAALSERLPKTPAGTGGGERVRVLRGDDDRLPLTFQAIPHEQLDAFVAVLSRLPRAGVTPAPNLMQPPTGGSHVGWVVQGAIDEGGHPMPLEGGVRCACDPMWHALGMSPLSHLGALLRYGEGTP